MSVDRAVWWALLALCAVGIWAANFVRRGGGAGEGPPLGEELSGRLALGASRAGMPLERVRLDTTDLRMVAVVAEIQGAEKARVMLEGFRGARDFDAFWRIYGEGLPPVPDEGFARRNGWFARLALSRGLPDDHPLRREVLGEARRTFVGLSLAAAGGFLAFLAGMVLLPLGIARLAQGRVRFAYEPPPRSPSDIVWLQTPTILLAGLIGIAFVGSWSMWALVLVPLWPLARGIGGAEWRAGLGLSRGKGIVREVFAGLVGYLAGIPVFAVGFLATLVLAGLIGEPVSHPAIDGAGDRSTRLHLFLATCVWAPLVEEAVFRGAFQRYLRPRMSRILAAALVGLVFAFVHPQGLAAIPVLLAIGGWFAVLREWRGTLVPCVAAHAAHNTALVSLAVFVLY